MTALAVAMCALIGLLLSGFFSGAETGLYCVNRLRLHLGVQRRRPDALRLAGVLDDEPGALSVALVGTNLSNYLTTACVAYLFADSFGYGEMRAQLYTVALATPVIFVFGEIVPKNLFQMHADRLMHAGSRVLVVANRFFRLTGVIWALKTLASMLTRLTREGTADLQTLGSKRRVAALLEEALAGSALGSEQSDLINRICRLSEQPVHAVMLPQNRVTVVPADTRRRALLRIERRTGHAQLPVFEKHPRLIVGTVKVDDLLQDDTWERVVERIRRPLKLRPHETVATAIARLRRAGVSMAIVTDRGGQMVGIVTIKDLLGQALGGLTAV